VRHPDDAVDQWPAGDSPMAILVEEARYLIEEIAEGTLFVALAGDAKDPDFDEFFQKFQPLLEARAPAKVLIDATHLGASSLSLRWKLAMTMKQNRPYIRRSAVFGLSERLLTVVRIILRASGRNNVKSFAERSEAESWLVEGDH
jgi:hypothetical protein